MALSITWYDQIDSTQNPAMKAAHEGAAAGHVWATDHQTAGRGRRHQGAVRPWHAPPGSGLMFSLLLRPALPPERASALTLAVAVGCARALEEQTGLAVQLKWPNDLFIDHRKVGGILTEGIVADGRTEALVVGVGINVNLAAADLPEPIEAIATSLLIAAGRPFDRLALLTSVVRGVRDAVDAAVARGGDLGELADAWEARSIVTGRRVALDPGGATGVVQGLAPDGGLSVALDQGGATTVRSGEVRFIQE